MITATRRQLLKNSALLGAGAFLLPRFNIAKAGPAPSNRVNLAFVGCLGMLAQRFVGRIEWISKAMKITNRPELNAHLKQPVRKGWEYGEDL